MTKSLMDAVKRSIADARARGELETDLPTAEDFSFFIWREIFRAIVHNEKQALETSKTLEIEVEVKQHDGHCSKKVRIIKIEVVCEPGKRPRLSHPLCASQERNANPNQSVRPKKIVDFSTNRERRTWDGAQPKKAAALCGGLHPSHFVYRDLAWSGFLIWTVGSTPKPVVMSDSAGTTRGGEVTATKPPSFQTKMLAVSSSGAPRF
jgi:hypothetical protein